LSAGLSILLAVVQPAAVAVPLAPGPAVVLAIHNRERAAFGSPPLAWNQALAATAQGWADHLARVGQLAHSPRAGRRGIGENLWLGTRGAFRPEAMVAGWASERRYFRRGIFPAVSVTGNWMDVSHYTQMVWPTTRAIGCAFGQGSRWDVLVCRYAPNGNRDGMRL
jgi:hypothetical protein